MAVQTTDISGWTATSGPTTVTPTTSATTGFSLQYPFLIQRSGPRKRKIKKKRTRKKQTKKEKKDESRNGRRENWRTSRTTWPETRGAHGVCVIVRRVVEVSARKRISLCLSEATTTRAGSLSTL